jgi:hypothetical protein
VRAWQVTCHCYRPPLCHPNQPKYCDDKLGRVLLYCLAKDNVLLCVLPSRCSWFLYDKNKMFYSLRRFAVAPSATLPLLALQQTRQPVRPSITSTDHEVPLRAHVNGGLITTVAAAHPYVRRPTISDIPSKSLSQSMGDFLLLPHGVPWFDENRSHSSVWHSAER